MNRRRDLLVALGTGALAVPLGGFAQQPAKAPDKLWRIGFLVARSRPASLDTDIFGGFTQGLRELGYIEGKHAVIEYRFADNDPARLPGLANDLVQAKVDLILASGAQAIHAAQRATKTIPIVMDLSGGDPVNDGFVASLARPGANITGPSVMTNDIGPKRLQMLAEIVPRLARLAVLFNPASTSSSAGLALVQAAATQLRITVVPVEMRSAQSLEAAFAQIKRDKAQALMVLPNALLNAHAREIAALAGRHQLPSIGALGEYAEAGGMLSYSTNFRDSFKRAAVYVDKIFKGTKPADLPVEQPTRFELFINGKTAKALGLKIPQSLLISAEKVIE